MQKAAKEQAKSMQKAAKEQEKSMQKAAKEQAKSMQKAAKEQANNNINLTTDVTDWLLRVGDGNNFNSSSPKHIWGISSKHINCSYFLKNVKEGDRLWFIMNKSQGKIIGVATFKSHNKRDVGPLIKLTYSNSELGWTNENGDDPANKWDTEIHYTNLYDISDDNYLTNIKSPCSIRVYNSKCTIDLSEEYIVIILLHNTVLQDNS